MMSSATFLVVEDEPFVARALVRTLSRHGRVVAAGSAAEARAALDGAVFSAVLADVGLPDGSGMDVVALARRRDPGVLALILSGFVDGARLADAHALGVHYLLKPVDPRQLDLFVERAAQRSDRRERRTEELALEWQDRFRLSPCESELLLLAALGKQRGELAEARQVAAATIKTQIKSLLGKINAPSIEVAASRLLRAALDAS